ncbi:MAG TPA: hypothetical protein ENF80_00130 [Thermofilum sp.]|nr:hypothetical protein [Thermofilum sp.]
MINEVSLVVSTLATLIPILTTLGVITYWLGRKFAEIEAKFGRIDEKFRDVDNRFEEIIKHIDLRVSRIAEAFRSYQEFFVEYPAAQGMLKDGEASMLKNEALRLMRLAATNPLTKEEWERIRRYLEKDELTLEEALELRELARKATDEYGERPEAWKLHIYASIMVGKAIRRLREKKSTSN